MPINLFNILNGVAGAKPPAGTRGGSPSNIAPARMPGVYAKSSARCRANQAYTALHHGEGVWG